MFSRRHILKSGGILPMALGGIHASAQSKPAKLTILSHRVHMSVISQGKSGDLTAEWSKKNGIAIEWVTLDTGPLHERMFREASLGSTSIDLAFMVNTRATPVVANLFEPLDSWMQSNPLEDPADLFPGLVNAMKFGGKQYAVPHRHATTAVSYTHLTLPTKRIV